MKNIPFKMITTLITLSLLIGCKKDNSLTGQIVDQPQSGSVAGSVLKTYVTCNRFVNVFTPTLETHYTLAMQNGFSYRKFGIPDLGTLDFDNIDKVTFEFSKQFADPSNTVKLYRIRRTDGKYLTFRIAAGYTTKLEGSEAQYQLWIVNSLGMSKYNLMLPKMYTCFLFRTYFDEQTNSNKAGFVAADQQTYPGSTTIYMFSDIVKMPATQ
ncbi:MAG: hypothetical protein EOO14_07620 [Chitinophagaceae bacterium]|nr:MAG: hypothetical protein EOO14_07620 [Chitinophagaceae bacterium]